MEFLKTRLILVLLLIAPLAYTQTYRFTTTGFSVCEKIKKPATWSSFTPSEMVITLDTEKNRIVVYSQEIQLYRILSYEPAKETLDDLIYPFICQDDDGEKFTISIITRKKQNNRKQLYIDQRDFIISYNIETAP